MNQEQILESISDHLDDLSALQKWGLLLAVGFWWAGIQHVETIEALGMNIQRSHALWVAVAFYLTINVTILERFIRLADLVIMTDAANFPKAISRLSLHSWILNPFAYYGKSALARIHSAKGLGGLIVVWWVCNSSLYSLSNNVYNPIGLLLQGSFLGVGLLSMMSINRIFAIVLTRTKKSNPDLHRNLSATRLERNIFTFVGIAIGGAVAFFTQLLL